MTLRVVFQPAARQDFEDALVWYEGRRSGLGSDFQAATDDAIRRAAGNPLMYPELHRHTRRVRVRRFPYSIFFIAEPNRIVVVAIFHARRNPRMWQSRA